jgi:hypothetical protein
MTEQPTARSLVLLWVGLLLVLGACGGSAERRAPAAAGATASDAPAAEASAAGAPAGERPAGQPVPTVYWVDVYTDSLYRATGPNFTDDELLVKTDVAPDGVAADVGGGKLYWTNMGSALGFGGGTLQRADLDGANVERIVEPGIATTPKQLQLDVTNGYVYWCDREGAKVWRAGLDGADPVAIVSEHGNQQLVGIALDVPGGTFYFSDRNAKKVFRANLEMPAGQTGADRTDIEEVLSFDAAAMPIDLDIDAENRLLYWTDRSLGTVQRADLDIPAGETPATRTDVETVVSGLTEPIGISLDVPNDRMYYGELGAPLEGKPGLVHEAALDGTNPREVGHSVTVAGVALVHVPAP